MRGAKQKEMFEISDLRRGRFFIILRSAASVRFSPGGRGSEGVLLYFHIHFFVRKLNIFGYFFRVITKLDYI